MALQMLYQVELGGSSPEEICAGFDVADYVLESETSAADEAEEKRRERARRAAKSPRLRASFDYACSLVRGTYEHREEIDELIRQQAENWRLERMSAIDRNILRLAIYEMLYESSVPQVVIVDEAIELAKKFGTESSGRFVNGLLDGVLHSQRGARPAAASSPPGGEA